MLETLDHTIRIGSTPTFLYFDLYHFTVLLFIVLYSVVAVKGHLAHRAFYLFSFGLALTKHAILNVSA